ncbi:MAG: Asp-tRNA(Asn)/Glu-tRNA(Gln) amidotransferase subunit GatC [Gemmatimonadaceae bacterium]
MAVTKKDVLHIADLARLGVDSEHAEALTRELSAILSHMEVLSKIDTSGVAVAADSDTGTPLRPDTTVPCGIAGVLGAIAPAMRDGFFIVPRLATHEDSTESGA